MRGCPSIAAFRSCKRHWMNLRENYLDNSENADAFENANAFVPFSHYVQFINFKHVIVGRHADHLRTCIISFAQSVLREMNRSFNDWNCDTVRVTSSGIKSFNIWLHPPSLLRTTLVVVTRELIYISNEEAAIINEMQVITAFNFIRGKLYNGYERERLFCTCADRIVFMKSAFTATENQIYRLADCSWSTIVDLYVIKVNFVTPADWIDIPLFDKIFLIGTS